MFARRSWRFKRSLRLITMCFWSLRTHNVKNSVFFCLESFSLSWSEFWMSHLSGAVMSDWNGCSCWYESFSVSEAFWEQLSYWHWRAVSASSCSEAQNHPTGKKLEFQNRVIKLNISDLMYSFCYFFFYVAGFMWFFYIYIYCCFATLLNCVFFSLF